MFDAIFPKHWTTLQRLMWLKTNALARAVYETITGNPVSFTAKAAPLRQLEVAFSPVQSLNGYDSPWPAGGGANKWDEEWEVGSYNVNGEPTQSSDTIRTKNYVPVRPSTDYYFYEGFSTPLAFVYFYDDSYAFLSSTTLSRNGAFTTPANANYLRFRLHNSYGTTYNHDIAINYPATVTTYSPYSNDCPISGWSSLTVEQRGKNLLQKSIEQIDNVAKELASCFFVKAGTYTVSFASANNATSWRFAVMMRDADGNNLSDTGHKPSPSMSWNAYGQVWLLGSNTTDKSITLTFVDDCYIRIVLAVGDTSTSTTVTDGMLELGSTASSYTPYNPSSRSISISLGQTVYSGYVDVISGVLTVTHQIVDLGTLTWVFHAYGDFSGGYSNSLIGTAKANDAYLVPNSVCSALSPIADAYFNYRNTGTNFCINSYATLKVTISNVTDSETLKSALSGVMLCYELATPIPIQLTPQEVQSLAGDNTMWSNANQPITVTYRSN